MKKYIAQQFQGKQGWNDIKVCDTYEEAEFWMEDSLSKKRRVIMVPHYGEKMALCYDVTYGKYETAAYVHFGS